jgi:hypothetical protein
MLPAESSITTKRQQWDENYDKVLHFAKEHGDLHLPRAESESRRLSNWLLGQKGRKEITNYELNKLAVLKDYGYNDGTTRAEQEEEVWNHFFNKLMEYKRVEGRFTVSKNDTSNKRLSNWIVRQRRMEKQGRLLFHRKKRLIEVGFVFRKIKPYVNKKRYTDKQEKTWDEMYASLCDFFQKQGHCNVTYNDDCHGALGKWVFQQRVGFRTGNIDDTRRQRLDEIKFTWSPK